MFHTSLYFVLVVLSFYFGADTSLTRTTTAQKLRGVRFLITVNDTWADPPGCITTIATPMIPPDLPFNKSLNLMIGSCDHGPLTFSVQSPGKNYNKYTLYLTFYSSVILDASHPTCEISWNGTYLVPKSPGLASQDLLPSCMTGDSREGYHMTYYWFHLLDWEFE